MPAQGYIIDVDRNPTRKEGRMTDTELLRAIIKKSGYKRMFIAKSLGLSYQGYLNKEEGRSEFRQSEIAALSEILDLSPTEREQIFFNQNIDR
jgi:hypothetical protein